MTFDRIEIALVAAVGHYEVTTLRTYRAIYAPGVQVRRELDGVCGYVLTAQSGEALERGTVEDEDTVERLVQHAKRTLAARDVEDDRDDCGSICNFCGGNGCHSCKWQGVNSPSRH